MSKFNITKKDLKYINNERDREIFKLIFFKNNKISYVAKLYNLTKTRTEQIYYSNKNKIINIKEYNKNSTSINYLFLVGKISKRDANPLLRLGITDLKDLEKYTSYTLLAHRSIGYKCINNLKKLCEEYNIDFE